MPPSVSTGQSVCIGCQIVSDNYKWIEDRILPTPSHRFPDRFESTCYIDFYVQKLVMRSLVNYNLEIGF
jgi:hypothetical protein